MKGYLIDTSIALTALGEPKHLTKTARRALDRGPAYISLIAYWEVMVKSMKGTLQVGDPRRWWAETLEALNLLPLLWRPEHVAELYNLPAIHQDPFDRAMIAQAIAEDLVLVTSDSAIPQYASGSFQPLT
ncbi:MAG TPA: type II toxin-antitoxin system VapC family toxin [Bryobacteraceae bacterium]